MKKAVVLGAGLVGKAMAIDLSKNFDVTAVDINSDALLSLKKHNVTVQQLDFSNLATLSKAIQPFDIVVGAVPGFMGLQTARTVIEAGKNMVDISFFPEDPFQLDELAKKHDVTIVTDCGVAPGMGNIILGYHNKRMKIDRYECLVGGLPLVREWPYEYKAVFSPIDVIEEYIRPARYVQSGAIVIKEALSDPELVYFDGVGTLESWNSDGLRSLIKTMKGIPHMIEKTLRYPGCIEYLRVLRESGFFSYEEMEIKGVKIRPIDITAKLLFPKWKLKPGEEEFTVMRIRMLERKRVNPKNTNTTFSIEQIKLPTRFRWLVLPDTHVPRPLTSLRRGISLGREFVHLNIWVNQKITFILLSIISRTVV
jgi:saccharopine dehydrogenase-like NADP-dependent oxidoreductase